MSKQSKRADISESALKFDQLPDSAQIGPREMCALLTCSPCTLKRRWQAGVIPEPIKVTRNTHRWRVADVRAALEKMNRGGK